MTTLGGRSVGPGTIIGLAGAVFGAVAGAAAGVAAERYVIKRRRRRAEDPYADEPFGELPFDRRLTVTTADGVDLNVEVVEVVEAEGGPQLTVVFVHGFCLDLGTWHFQRQAFTGSTDPRVRMVFYDQPGHAESGRSPSGDYTIDQLGADLAAVVAEVAPDGPLVLVGHSMGGMTIMSLAEHNPGFFAERVAGVALVSTSAGHLDDVALGMPPVVARLRPTLMPTVTRALRWQAGIAEYGRRAGSDLGYLLTKRYGFGSPDPSPALVEYVERMNTATPIGVIAGYLSTLSEHDRYASLEVFADLEVLVVCGDRDLLTPVEHTREIARLLPRASLLEVPDGGHCTLLEHSTVVDAALGDLFSRSVAAAAGRAARPARGRDEVAARAERRAKASRGGAQQRGALGRILRRKGA